MCLYPKVLASLQVILNFFFTFPKKWVGRAMGYETFYGDGQTQIKKETFTKKVKCLCCGVNQVKEFLYKYD